MTKPDVRGFFDPVTATWTYIVYARGNTDRRCTIIDSVLDYDQYTGRIRTASADRVVDFVKANKLEVQWILETHIHADHVTAASYLKKKLGGKIGVSQHILKILETWVPIFHTEQDTPLDGNQFDHVFADGESFEVGPFKASIIHTAGHTPADTSYVIEDAVFVGDTMFLPDVGTGRCDFPGGSAEASFESSRKLFAFPDNYRMYVGHDYPPHESRLPECMTTIGEQKQLNVRVREGIAKNDFIFARQRDDTDKDVPKLLYPSIQVNLRAGNFGQSTQGVQYIKIPVTNQP